MAKEWTADSRLEAGVAPEIVAAMYGLDVKELKEKQRKMNEEQKDWGGRIAIANAAEQPKNEVKPEVETDEFGVNPKPVAEAPAEEPKEAPKVEAPAPQPKKKAKKSAKKKK